MSKRTRAIARKRTEISQALQEEKQRAIKKAHKMHKKKEAAAATEGDVEMKKTKVKHKKIRVRKHHIKIKKVIDRRQGKASMSE